MAEDKYNLRAMSDDDLYGFIVQWKPHSVQYIAGMQELRRRNESSASFRSWVAISISIIALIVSIIALIRKW